LVADIRKEPEVFEELLSTLDDNRFVFKKQYLAIKEFYESMSARLKTEEDGLADLL
jgi:hypothetical protein